MTPDEKLAALEELVGKENIHVREIDPDFWSAYCGMLTFISNNPEHSTLSEGCFCGQGDSKEAAIEDYWHQNILQTEDTGYLRIDYGDGTHKFAKWFANQWLITEKPFLGLRAI